MEYVNKGSLHTLIQQTYQNSNSFTEKQAFKYFIQTVSAVYFLHENNLVHRDIKPENLLLDDKDQIKLCDFGWCVELTIGNRITFCGTYEYMAPEIIKEMPYNHSIDTWSLGVLLYELLHGYSPFKSKDSDSSPSDQNENYSDIFKNIVKVKFSIDRKDISEDCVDLIHKLLSLDNKTRIKIKDILTHQWVTNFEKQDIEQINLNKSARKSVELCYKSPRTSRQSVDLKKMSYLLNS